LGEEEEVEEVEEGVGVEEVEETFHEVLLVSQTEALIRRNQGRIQ
jgi:hypothetical protein